MGGQRQGISSLPEGEGDRKSRSDGSSTGGEAITKWGGRDGVSLELPDPNKATLMVYFRCEFPGRFFCER